MSDLPSGVPGQVPAPAEQFERKMRRAAVVVFLECEGWDERDAAVGGMLAVQQTLAGKVLQRTAEITGRGASGEFKARVADVMPLNDALANGYVRVTPTARGFQWLDALDAGGSR